jgi:hypothetical protein
MTPLGEFRENKLMLIERSSPRHVCALTTAKGYVMSLLEMYRLSVRVLGPDSESAQANEAATDTGLPRPAVVVRTLVDQRSESTDAVQAGTA